MINIVEKPPLPLTFAAFVGTGATEVLSDGAGRAPASAALGVAVGVADDVSTSPGIVTL
jgi:hypothetical protein